MISPQDLPSPGVSDIQTHEIPDRAGPYKISDLQSLLDPFSSEDQSFGHTRGKWPFGYTLIGALIVCAALWCGIIWAITAVL